MSDYLDWDKAVRGDSKRINIDLPTDFLAGLDREAARRRITRQSLIKVWLYDRLKNESSSNVLSKNSESTFFMEYQEVIPLLKDLSFELSRVETLAFSQLEKARLAYWEASRPGCLRGVAAGEGNFWNKSPWALPAAEGVVRRRNP